MPIDTTKTGAAIAAHRQTERLHSSAARETPRGYLICKSINTGYYELLKDCFNALATNLPSFDE